MKKTLLLFSIIILSLLCACNPVNESADSAAELKNSDPLYHEGTDSQYFYRKSGEVSPITSSPNGYYCVGTRNMVIYIDKNTMKATPLCNKLNCTHSDNTTCDAYFLSYNRSSNGTSGSNVIQYYDGALYYITTEENTTTMSAEVFLAAVDDDGKNMRKITDKLVYEGPLQDWLLHRGYMYGITTNKIFRISLDNPKKTEVIYELDEYQEGLNNINSVLAYDDYLYFGVYIFDDNNDFSRRAVYALNLETLEAVPCVHNGNDINLYSVINGKIVFSVNEIDGYNAWYKADPNFTNIEKIGDFKVSEHILCDGNYIYIDNDPSFLPDENAQTEKPEDGYYGQTITVCDLDMNKVDSFVIPSKYLYFNLTPQDTENFILYLPTDEEQKKFTLYAIDKSKIGTYNGKPAELIELCKTSWANPNDGYNYE